MSTNTFLAIGLVASAAVVIVLVLVGQFGSKPPPPPPPPPPPAPAQSLTELLRYKPDYFKALLADDAKRFGTVPPAVSALEQPAPYFDELATPRRLKADHGVLETAHLRLRTLVKKLDVQSAGQGFRFDHALLEITNKTEKPIAYRVITSVDHPERCNPKGALPQNALALEPGGTTTRTECLYHGGLQILVQRVEVMELPSALSYFYVSRLDPGQLGLDNRTAAGHGVPGLKTCPFVPWRTIQAASWADVIDFYARHNCDEYSFWSGYHRWTAAGILPSREP